MDQVRQHDTGALWAPVRQMTLAQARQRSQMVRALRLLFVALAAISIGFFIGHMIKSALTSDAKPIELAASETVTMKNPRFSGRDSTGNVFTITAEAAQRKRMSQTAVDLINPVLKDGLGTAVSAPRGMYDRDAGILELYDDVNISDKAGYSFRTQGARVHVGKDWVEGLSPLEGKGPLGDIRSDSYEIFEGGNRVVFEGNVKTVIYPAEPEELPAEESE